MIKVNCNEIKRLRLNKGIGQKVLADLLDYKDPSAYNKLENGEREFSIPQLKIIANYFFRDINELIIDESEASKMMRFTKECASILVIETVKEMGIEFHKGIFHT